MTKQEYINSLSVEQLRSLVNTFSEMLHVSEQASYYDAEDLCDEDEDYTPPCFFCPHSGHNFLDNEE
jgi:hypothetical protein